jgi:hypothetical protein
VFPEPPESLPSLFAEPPPEPPFTPSLTPVSAAPPAPPPAEVIVVKPEPDIEELLPLLPLALVTAPPLPTVTVITFPGIIL